MKNLRVLSLTFIAFALIFSSIGCQKKEEKTAAAAAAPIPDGNFISDIEVISPDKEVTNPLSIMQISSVRDVKVRVKNLSNAVWPAKGQADGRYATRFAYHWLDKDGKVLINDGLRTELPSDLAPGQEIVLVAKVKAPEQKGEYILEFDIVQEFVTWFSQQGSKTVKLNVKVGE